MCVVCRSCAFRHVTEYSHSYVLFRREPRVQAPVALMLLQGQIGGGG